MTRQWLLTAAALIGLGGVAAGADLPTRKSAPEPLPPVFTWAGAYVGANVGAGLIDGKADPACINPAGVSLGLGCAIAPSFKLSSAGFIGGAQAGYNLQYNMLVLGVETDIQGAGVQKSSSANGQFPQTGGTLTGVGAISASERLNYFGTVRGRLGIAYDRALLYATGGLIYADVDNSFQRLFPAVAFVGSSDQLRLGGVVGGGLEYAFTDHWSGKVEGLYYDLGRQTLLSTALPLANGFRTGYRFQEDGEIVRVGLNYKLW